MKSLWVLAAALGFVACAGVSARWHGFSKAKGHAVPESVAIYVAVSEQAAGSDDGGSVLALVDALDAALTESGHRTRYVGARLDEKPPLPRVEIQVLTADWGKRGMRGAGNMMGLLSGAPGIGLAAAPAAVGLSAAGSGSLLVDCYVVQADGTVTFAGRISAGTFGSESGGYDTAGPERAGRLIAMAIER